MARAATRSTAPSSHGELPAHDDRPLPHQRGDEAFCAGADLKSYIPPIIRGERDIRAIVDLGLGGLTRGMHRIRKPVIAAVNGWALGGGLEMALACDIRIASERARFGSFEARRGYHHGDGGIVRLVNACGVGVAGHLLVTAEPIDAAQALQWNLVTKVVAHDELLQRFYERTDEGRA
jgi:enoyl-CoA hydratase/carnithine racemase